MRRTSFLATLGALFSLLAMGCNNDNNDLPDANSRNDYQFFYTITATEGNVDILFAAQTDGEKVLIDGKDMSLTEPSTYIDRVSQGETKRFVLSSKAAKEFSVKISLKSQKCIGHFTFENHRNGKSIKEDKTNFKVVANETPSYTHFSYTTM